MNYELMPLTIKMPDRNNNGHFTHAMPGKDGIDGDLGVKGEPGLDGSNGISVVDAFLVDDLSFKFELSNGTFSQKIALPIAEDGTDGKPGRKGEDGKRGDAGKAAPTIVDIKAFSRRVIFVFSDGTEKGVPIKFPAGSGNNPGLAFGGMEPPVKDIVGVGPIEVEDRNGIFFISIDTQDNTIGLPYYFIEPGLTVTVPLNRQHMTLGDVDIEGEFIVEGEWVVI